MSTVNNKLNADRTDAQAAALDQLQRGRKGQHSGLIFYTKEACDRRDLTRVLGMVHDDEFDIMEDDPVGSKLLALDDAGYMADRFIHGPDKRANYWIDFANPLPEEDFEDEDGDSDGSMNEALNESVIEEIEEIEEYSFVDAVLNWDRYRTRYE